MKYEVTVTKLCGRCTGLVLYPCCASSGVSFPVEREEDAEKYEAPGVLVEIRELDEMVS